MQIVTEKQTLLEAFETVSRAISPRSPLPILSHVLLEASDTALRLTATDLDLSIHLSTPCNTVQTGSLCLPAALLKDIIGKLPSGQVGLHAEQEGRITLLAGRSKFVVTTLPAEEFPTLPQATGNQLDLPQKALKEAIRLVLPAVAKSDESRAVMTGAQVELDGGHLVLCATDGRRLAWARAEASTVDKQVVIVPGRALQELARACADTEDPIALRLEHNHLWVAVRNLSMHCRLLEGLFPDYKRVLPTEFLRFARVGREALSAGLKRVLIVAQERASPNLVCLDFDDGRLLLSTNTPDMGFATEEIPCNYEGAPLRIAFNGRYVLDGLAVLSCEEVVFDLQDDTRSAVLHEGDPHFRYVLMPVRLREAIPEEGSQDGQ